MNPVVENAIASVNRSIRAFCKFISANDAGKTGGHQEGFYIPKNSYRLLFPEPGVRGQNKDKFVRIRWQNDFERQSRFIYYGQETRNEYRLTRFGRGFPFLTEDSVGDLLILCEFDGDYYEGYVLQNDADVEDFLSAFNLSPSDTCSLIDKDVSASPDLTVDRCLTDFVNSRTEEFPATIDIAARARDCFNKAHGITARDICEEPDRNMINWLDIEYQLFKIFEHDRYGDRIKTPFSSVSELITFSNTILNRRKSRAGKSLEHHLGEIFSTAELRFERQAITEDRKKPDFLFPDASSYRNSAFARDNLIVLAAKTTCKDRWRQILNEADRIKIKHLFTLQQGVSKNQLDEMYKYDVQLIVPKPYIAAYPKEYRHRILSLRDFLRFVKSKQN